MSGRVLALQKTPSPAARGPMRALRIARIIHPFPTLLNVGATVGLAVVAVRGAPDGGVLVRMMLLMFCAQSAIGIVNDCCDRELDAATKPWKPVAAGLISPPIALAVAAALIAATGALGLSLGAGSFALGMLGLASGLAYDVRLKRTVLSAVPYMTGITTLPLWVWVTLGKWDGALWWLLPLGSLIGIALHLANTLPDIDSDSAHGVRGLAHRLGARRSMYAGWASFGGALVVSALLAPVLHYDLRLYVPAVSVGTGCLVASVVVYLLRRDAVALQLGFGALGVGSALVAVGWLAAVS